MPAPASLLELLKAHPAELTISAVSHVAAAKLTSQRVAEKLLSNPADLNAIYEGDANRVIAGAHRAVVLREVREALVLRARFSSDNAQEIVNKVFELSPEAADELRSVLHPRGKRGRDAVASFLERRGVYVSFLSSAAERVEAAFDRAKRLADAKYEKTWLREQARVQREREWSQKSEDAEREQARRGVALLKEQAKTERAAARQLVATKTAVKKKLAGVGTVEDTKRLLAELKRRALKKKD